MLLYGKRGEERRQWRRSGNIPFQRRPRSPALRQGRRKAWPVGNSYRCWGNTGETKSANLRALIERNRLRCPWFIGDTEGDFEAARDNGVRFIHASYGFGQVERSDHRINRFADLLTFWGTLLT